MPSSKLPFLNWTSVYTATYILRVMFADDKGRHNTIETVTNGKFCVYSRHDNSDCIGLLLYVSIVLISYSPLVLLHIHIYIFIVNSHVDRDIVNMLTS